MRLHRFYVKQPLGEELVVGSAEEKELLHQLTSVFRYTRGNEVIFFSSHDTYDYTYFIKTISKKEAVLVCISKVKNISPSRECTLYMALVKKDTFETIVRQATELGISDIVPVLADKSEKKNLNFERLTSISQEASEQCGRGTLPRIHPIVTYKEAISEIGDGVHVFTSLYGEPVHTLSKELRTCSSVWIGPEGGWSKEEEDLAKNTNCLKTKLTETTLKADTAAIAMLSLVILL